MTEAQETLLALANKEIEKLRDLPQPIVRVCGPLTADGPEGYEENARRLQHAEAVLAEQGKTIWGFGEAEEEIFGKGYDHTDVMEYFHAVVFRSGLIKEAYFLPRWQESTGASREHELCLEYGVIVKDFPEEWLVPKEQDREFKQGLS